MTTPFPPSISTWFMDDPQEVANIAASGVMIRLPSGVLKWWSSSSLLANQLFFWGRGATHRVTMNFDFPWNIRTLFAQCELIVNSYRIGIGEILKNSMSSFYGGENNLNSQFGIGYSPYCHTGIEFLKNP